MNRFYLTFGQRYRWEVHPTFGKAHPDGWVTIDADDYEDARAIAVTALGPAWSGLYPESDWDPKYYSMGELLHLARRDGAA